MFPPSHFIATIRLIQISRSQEILAYARSIHNITQSEGIYNNHAQPNPKVPPSALMMDISDGNFEEAIKAVRQAKAMIAFNSMRKKAEERGFMADEEIGDEITAYRREKKAR